jgi:hypothetical protein
MLDFLTDTQLIILRELHLMHADLLLTHSWSVDRLRGLHIHLI